MSDTSTNAVVVTGASTNIKGIDLSAKLFTIGVNAYKEATDVEWRRITTRYNTSTGIYHNSPGTTLPSSTNLNGVFECLSYGNGTGGGDGGGIGVQSYNSVIADNVVYNNGGATGDRDYEISIVQSNGVGYRGPVWVLRNHISQAVQGGIQLAEGCSGSVVAYNYISGANTSAGTPSSIGKWSGIRLGGGATVANSGTKIVNNTIVNSGSGHATSGLGLSIIDTGPVAFEVKNNLFYENATGEVLIQTGVTTTNTFFDNNLYYNSVGNLWNWKGTNRTSLTDWKTSSSYTELNTLTIDPQFILPTDFRLQPTSSALKAGTFTTGVHDQPGCKDLAGIDCNSMAIPIGAYGRPTAQPTLTGF